MPPETVTAPSAQVLAVCRVHALREDEGPVGVTAIDKRPVDGPVTVGPLGLRGDVQADRRFHGGEDKALYAYADEEAALWSAELGKDIPPGLFGENLRTLGLGTTTAVVGERWRIGAAVEVEVTSPRIPCSTFARRIDEERWVKRFSDTGRVGTYLRVIRPGPIEAGHAITVVHRPAHGVTVGRWFSERSPADARLLHDAHAGGLIRLCESMLDAVQTMLARTDAEG
ncbi:MOSC domain-containing protein [Sanguibacter antarcticus]|uniref:MOSC domain-containing protein YiiM n=1 Tax=Sanguibacter antarcticus TaxID=372484 RepID=A0A2A9E3P4_9MICO|nr:MOSC domain-containing protein [Sanguibacter antarcticus]PFG32819.1 MOSC domain-containing protein YiiM [Sanguibacter antarcticus]